MALYVQSQQSYSPLDWRNCYWVILMLLFSLYYFGLVAPLNKLYTSWLSLPIWLVLAFWGMKAAWTYPKQTAFIDKIIIQSLSFYDALTTQKPEQDQYIGQGLKMQKQLQVNKDQQVDKLVGTEYLNALLFSRYRQVFNKNSLFVHQLYLAGYQSYWTATSEHSRVH